MADRVIVGSETALRVRDYLRQDFDSADSPVEFTDADGRRWVPRQAGNKPPD